MSIAKKTTQILFRRIRGRIIPFKVSLRGGPDEAEKIHHIIRARDVLKKFATSDDFWDRKMQGVFYKIAKTQSKTTGDSIAKRISRLARKK